jgi:hypothetical protein
VDGNLFEKGKANVTASVKRNEGDAAEKKQGLVLLEQFYHNSKNRKMLEENGRLG